MFCVRKNLMDAEYISSGVRAACQRHLINIGQQIFLLYLINIIFHYMHPPQGILGLNVCML